MEGHKHSQLNQLRIPDYLPEDLSTGSVPQHELERKFERFADELEADPIESKNQRALDRAGTLLTHLGEQYESYTGKVNVNVIATKVDAEGTVTMLADPIDRMQSILVSAREYSEHTPTFLFERISGQCRIVLQYKSERNREYLASMVQVTPSAFNEMLGNLDAVGRYLRSSLHISATQPNEVPVASTMFDRLIDRVQAKLAERHMRAGVGSAAWISDLLDLEILPGSENRVAIRMVVDSGRRAQNGYALDSREEIHTLKISSDQYGFLTVEHLGSEDLGPAKPRQRKSTLGNE